MTEQTATQEMLTCTQCKRTFGRSDLVQIAGNWVCGGCKTAFLSRVVAGDVGVSGSSLRYAGVGIRFGARFIDGLVFGVPFIILVFTAMPSVLRTGGNRANIFNGAFIVASIVFSLFYEVLMLRYWGATVGKMACGIKVVRPDGGGLGWGVSFGRFMMYNVVISAIPLVNWILLLTTVIMCGRDNESRALEDRVCGTRVVYKDSLAAA